MTSSQSRMVTVAALQCPLADSADENLQRVVTLIHQAADAGANIVLPSELFEGPYFPQEQKEEFFDWAHPVEGNATIAALSKIAAERQLVIPYSFYEKAGQAFYNSIVVIDADGRVLGTYRKSHIPDGPGYQEKFYFRPGDTGFKVWATRYGRIGVGICWDQWYPEAARAMTLMGAELLFYPTAIGSEPEEPENDTQAPWQRAMIGHAVSNAIPVIAANRVGREGECDFYGSSFIADHRGDKVSELDRTSTGIAHATIDLDACNRYRANWGFFRDRRPDLYGALLTADGTTRVD